MNWQAYLLVSRTDQPLWEGAFRILITLVLLGVGILLMKFLARYCPAEVRKPDEHPNPPGEQTVSDTIGHGKWKIEALKGEIRKGLKDPRVCQPKEDRVEFSLVTLSGGSQGIHQPSDIFSAFNMKPPAEFEGHPVHEYNPDEDESIWDSIDWTAREDADAILEALVVDPDFTAEMDAVAEGWSIYFGHREADGDYCLFFWCITKEDPDVQQK